MGGFGKRKGGGGSVILTDLQVDGTTVTVDASNNRLGVGTASPKTELTVEGTLTMKEAAAASGDTAAYGQLWIKNDAPCNLYFTDDTGQDVQITSDGSLAGVSGALSGLGSNDNRILRTNGTGGETAQGSGITVDDSANMSGVGTLGVGAITTSGDLTVNADSSTFTSANANDPLITIKNTTNDADGARLRFVKDKGAAGAANDVAGLIEFYADDAAQDQVLFAKMEAAVAVHTDGQEGGKLSLGVATHDGEMQYGLVLTDGSVEDEIDVTIGNGAASLTTVAGDLEVTTDLKVSGDTSLHNEGSNCLLTLEGLAGANSAIQFKETNHYWSMGHRGSDNAFFIRDSLSTTGDIIQIEENAGDNLIYAKAGSLLGINTDAPTDTLTVAGSIYVSTTAHVIGAVTLGNTLLVTGSIGGAGLSISNNDEGTSNTILGGSAGAAVASGCNLNVIIGHEAGNDLSSGDNNVLIGYQAGDKTTDVDGAIVIGHGAAGGNLTAAADGTILIGTSAGAALTTGAGNTAVGFEALKTNVDGDFNTAFGYQALETFEADADGHGSNTAVGYNAGQAVSTGTGNTILGAAAGDALQGGDDNIFIGGGAGGATTAGGNIICVGVGAGAAVMTSDADGSIFVGTNTGAAITTGQYNTAVGHNALDVDVAGDGSTAVGYQALTAQTGTDGTVGATAVGYLAGKMNESGISSTFLGWKSGPQSPGSKLTGDNNTSVGAEAGGALAGAGHSNTFVGSQAGLTTTTGVENTCLGFNADIQDATATNQIVIGNNITGTKDNAVFIGNDSSHIENDFNTDATWNHSSDVRQKTNIQDDVLGLNFVNDLRTVTYTHKSPSEFPEEWTAYNPDDTEPMGGGKTIHGFIAQEVKEALDKAGCDTFSGWSVDPDGRQRVSFEAFVMPLIKAVQELSAKVEELEGKLDK